MQFSLTELYKFTLDEN